MERGGVRRTESRLFVWQGRNKIAEYPFENMRSFDIWPNTTLILLAKGNSNESLLINDSRDWKNFGLVAFHNVLHTIHQSQTQTLPLSSSQLLFPSTESWFGRMVGPVVLYLSGQIRLHLLDSLPAYVVQLRKGWIRISGLKIYQKNILNTGRPTLRGLSWQSDLDSVALSLLKSL